MIKKNPANQIVTNFYIDYYKTFEFTDDGNVCLDFKDEYITDFYDILIPINGCDYEGKAICVLNLK